jgi:RimJ/RimL family protein N-acetyltransferase
MQEFLQGERVYLSPLEESDLDQLHGWKNDLTLASQILARPFPTTRDEIGAWHKTNQADKNQVLLAIRPIGTNDLIGIARLMFIDWLGRTCELGIFIGPGERRGKGLGKEVVRLLVRHAFEGLNLRRVHLRVAESNAAAMACYRACGFVQEGVLREHAWNAGRYENVALMGLLRSGTG